MPIDRDDAGERRARLEALLEDARKARERFASAIQRARALVARSQALRAAQERREQRDRLLKKATDALKMAKASGPIVLPFRRPGKHKRA